MVWDIFISHASEDKDAVARPLADNLIKHGLNVWYDEYTLTLGDSLRRSIDKGLAGSRYGLVILSPHFFEKEWTQKELDGLVAREDGSEKRILPVWHNVSRKDVVSFSPPLADKLGVSTTRGLDHVVREIIRVLKPDAVSKPAAVTSKSKRPRTKKKAGVSSAVVLL
jgi:TIR domain